MNQKEAKAAILENIKSAQHQDFPLQDIPPYTWEGDPVENFIKKLVSWDGKAAKFKTKESAIGWLANQPEMDSEKFKIYTTVEGVKGNFSEADLTPLANAHNIHTCVTEGLMGVGETGSIWVTDKSLGHAACALLARQLFIFLDCKLIESSIQQAYARINLAEQQYGSFFTGPSATADIEAVRITGAQGPLGLTALIYNCQDAQDTPKLIINPNTDVNKWIKVEDEPD